MNILLIDSDHRHNDTITRLMQTLHHQVDQVFDGLSGLQYHQNGVYDVTLLMAPMQQMEPWKTYLSSKPDGLTNRVHVVETTNNEDIMKIVKEMNQHPQSMHAFRQFGDISFDEKHGTIHHQDRSITLSPSEQQILRVLLECPGEPVAKTKIKEMIWNKTDVSDNRLEVHISSLRKKLIQLESNVVIRSKRFHGYWITQDESTP